MTRLKQVVDDDRQITYGIVQAGPNVPGGVPYVRPADMSDEAGVRNLASLLRTSPQIADNYKRSSIDSGDLVCSIGPSFGKVMSVPEELQGANLTQGTARVAISTENSARFYFWVLRSPGAFQQWESSVGGATFRALNLRPLAETQLPHPSLEEQVQIARFLDYETAKIDALIEKQQQLIALLKEKRQAVISHVVTKGLNPDAPMRDSGVEWLGEVPAHWEVKRLKHLFLEPLRNGVSPQAAETGGVPTFSIAAVRDGGVDIGSHVKYAAISEHAAHPYKVQQGDVMMMRGNGSRDLVGTVGIVNSPPPYGCIYPDILIRLRFSRDIRAQLAVLFLNSSVSRPQVAMGAKTAAGIWKVSGGTVSEFLIPLPPPEEQALLVEYLRLALSGHDTLVELVESKHTLLQERRTALISAAVTGKIDVRGWSAPESMAKAEVVIA